MVNSQLHTHKTARQLHDDIEQTLAARPPDERRDVSRLEQVAKKGGRVAWHLMQRHPFVAVTILAVGGAMIAAEIGVAELAFGAALALGAYKVLREGEPPLEALEELEHDIPL